MTNVYSLQIYEIYREKRYGFFFFHRKKRKRRARFRRGGSDFRETGLRLNEAGREWDDTTHPRPRKSKCENAL